MRHRSWYPTLMIALVVTKAVDAQPPAARSAPPPQGRMEQCRYVSAVDGATIEYALWYPPEYDAARAWPLIVFLHGSGEGGTWDAPTQPTAGIPVRTVKSTLPFLVVSPLMRGTWSINGLAERDVLDTLADVQARAHVDPERIHLTGLSLGAFAGWAVAAHQPDRFASLSLFAGGGQPELVGNLRSVTTWVFHGAADPNVPPEESVRMVHAMQALGLPVRYTEFPGGKHDCWQQPYAGDMLYRWMTEQTRIGEPRRITYRTFGLRHQRAYWATIDSVIDPARPAFIDIFNPAGAEIYVHAENVGQLTLAPPPTLVASDSTPAFFSDSQPAAAERTPAGWVLELAKAPPGALHKRHGLSGPIQDVFWEPFVVVTADAADPVVAGVWSQVAQRAFKWTAELTFQKFRFVSARDVTPEIIQSCNLICVGNPENHSLLAQVADRLPLVFTRDGLRVERQAGAEEIMGFVMIYPNPLNPERYLVVCSGQPQAVGALAPGVLQPPFLSPTPVEDVVVVARDGTLCLQAAPAEAASRPAWMAAEIPSRGAVFDRTWQLPPTVAERLRHGPGGAAPTTRAANP